MRVILDECLPRGLANHLIDHQVLTVPQAGFAGLTNGELLRRIEGLPAQNVIASYSFGVIILRSQSNRLASLIPLVSGVLKALAAIRPGDVIVVVNE